MLTKRYSQLIVLLTAAFLAALSLAAQEWELTLKPFPGEQGARGGVIIRDKAPVTRGATVKEITINATGLRPASVYTVWFVNEKTRTALKGIGDTDYSFTSDKHGNGSYTAYIYPAELDEWLNIEIARHPDGTPLNTGAMKPALRANLLNCLLLGGLYKEEIINHDKHSYEKEEA